MHPGEAVVRRDPEVGGEEHRDDAGIDERAVDVHGGERGVRHLGAGEHAVQLARQIEVGDVRRAAGQQRGILSACHAGPQDRADHRGNLSPRRLVRFDERPSSSMEEQWTFNPLVQGSSPWGGTCSEALLTHSTGPEVTNRVTNRIGPVVRAGGWAGHECNPRRNGRDSAPGGLFPC